MGGGEGGGGVHTHTLYLSLSHELPLRRSEGSRTMRNRPYQVLKCSSPSRYARSLSLFCSSLRWCAPILAFLPPFFGFDFVPREVHIFCLVNTPAQRNDDTPILHTLQRNITSVSSKLTYFSILGLDAPRCPRRSEGREGRVDGMPFTDSVPQRKDKDLTRDVRTGLCAWL